MSIDIRHPTAFSRLGFTVACALISGIGPIAGAYEVTRDIPFDSPGSWPTGYTRLDLYTPNGGAVPGAPTILNVHGGGYIAGDKRDDQPLSGQLADRGFNVISINYTLATSGVSSFPQAIRDVKAAIRWARTEGLQRGLGPRVVLLGSSAGATIGVAAAYAVGVPEFELLEAPPQGGYAIDAVVAIYGRYDMVWDATTHGSPQLLVAYLGGPISNAQYAPLYSSAAAITYVRPCTPPTFMLHGDADWLVPYQHSVRLAGALSDAGVFNILQIVPGGGHGSGVLGDPTYLASQAAIAIPQLLAHPSPLCGGGDPSRPPINDHCSEALPISPGQAVTGSTLGASGTLSTPCGASTDTRDVWYRFVPALTRLYTFDTIDPAPAFSSTISVYSDCGTSGTLVGCDRGSGGNWCARLRVALTAGQPYFIRIAGSNGAAGPFQLNVGVPEPVADAPDNDLCTAASPIGLGSTYGTTLGAELSIDGCGSNDHDDVWFQFTPAIDAAYRFDTRGSDLMPDTTLALRLGCEDPPLVCNDDEPAGGRFSLIDQPLSAGQTVLIRVAGNAGASGPFRLNIERLPDAGQGACCTLGTCVIATESGCPQGVWSAGQPCSVVACTPPPPPGACCATSGCTIADNAASCAGAFAGHGLTCGTPGNPTSCCRANFNQLDGLSVQDVFDYIAAYFEGAPAADFNRNGSLSTQDIFDFLSEYFRGCP